MAISLTQATAATMCDAVADLPDGGTGSGKIKIYDGTPPADADTALSSNTLLATLTFSATAFGAAADSTGEATATANSITADSSADATGTASFYRVTDGDDTVLWQGSVGTSGADLNLNTPSITAGQEVSCTSMTLVLNEAQT